MERQEHRVITLTSLEHSMVIRALNDMRNDLLQKQHPTDLVDDVLLKAIDAPRRRGLHSLVSPASGQKLDRSVAPPLPTKSSDFAGAPEKNARCRDEAR